MSPWDRWIPGVLSRAQVTELIKGNHLENFDFKACDHSSIDLHVTGEAYLLTEGSVKPSGGNYLQSLKTHGLARALDGSSKTKSNGFLLESRKTYLFKLKERLGTTNEFKSADFYGQSTAKSSIGRLDVLARLIVDGSQLYEGFTPPSLREGNGCLFLEVTPITFPIIVHEGDSLTQLRFFIGNPDDSEIHGATISKVLLPNGMSSDGMLSVNLENVLVAGKDAVAFCSRRAENCSPIDLSASKALPPNDYWDIVPSDHNKRLQIQAGSFYIIRSYEKIAVPGGVAVYCRAIDESIGEIRIHYAGFVHPFFGLERKDGEMGTPLIFEVRGHDLNVSLNHKEKMAKLTFYRMSEDAIQEEKEGAANKSSSVASPYMNQTLQLSKHFGPWS
jgi:dCTP deaminase